MIATLPAVALAGGLLVGAAHGAGNTLLSDLAPETRAAVEVGEAGEKDPLPVDPQALLERVFRASRAYYFAAGPLSVRTDRRWYSTLPNERPGAPFLVLRRWPGDTVAALYALKGLPKPVAEAVPPELPGGRFGTAVSSDAGIRWDGSLATPLGERPAVWIESVAPESELRVGWLLLPGDAGLGPTAVADRLEELLSLRRRVTWRREAARELLPLAAGVPLVVPELGAPPKDHDEREDPWQVARAFDFTLGLPPGIRAKLIRGVPPPREIPGATLWLRGRFFDRDGLTVVVGDGARAGYVAEIPAPGPDWVQGKAAPVGAPEASRVAGERFDVATEATGCRTARAERWKESGFGGEWLVFRLGFPEKGIEIGLPVVEGRRSLALFWIPVTWRSSDQPPAPPPIDAAKRFGIRFEKLQGPERRSHPLTEGYLVVPGLRLQLPKGWWPVANLRSTDGFPVRFLDPERNPVGTLIRLDETELPEPDESSGWAAQPRPKAQGARAVYRREDGAWLFLSRTEGGFLLEPGEVDPTTLQTWEGIARTALLSRARKR